MKKRTKSLIFYKTLFIILIIAAIVIFSIIFKKQYDDREYDKENDNITTEFHEAEEKIKDSQEGENNPIQLKMYGYNVIGLIKIPAIDLEYPIIERTTKESMRLSISRFYGGDINEPGNVSLAGHNNYSGTMFGKNNKLKLGDKVFLTDLTSRTIEYEIYDIFVTDPNDTSILETKEKDIREVTLITCKNGRSERLIIKAREILN